VNVQKRRAVFLLLTNKKCEKRECLKRDKMEERKRLETNLWALFLSS
jgi:hypothetical protein